MMPDQKRERQASASGSSQFSSVQPVAASGSAAVRTFSGNPASSNCGSPARVTQCLQYSGSWHVYAPPRIVSRACVGRCVRGSEERHSYRGRSRKGQEGGRMWTKRCRELPCSPCRIRLRATSCTFRRRHAARRISTWSAPPPGRLVRSSINCGPSCDRGWGARSSIRVLSRRNCDSGSRPRTAATFRSGQRSRSTPARSRPSMDRHRCH